MLFDMNGMFYSTDGNFTKNSNISGVFIRFLEHICFNNEYFIQSETQNSHRLESN